jgi:hypothetical protein
MEKFKKDLNNLMKSLNIEEKTIKAKYRCKVHIQSELYSKNEIQDVGPYYKIPGFLEIFMLDGPNEGDVLEISLPYTVNLHKNDTEEDDSDIIITYEKGETILSGDYVASSTDISYIDRLFEGRVKFLNNDVITKILLIHKNMLSTSNISLHHIETLVQGTYSESKGDKIIPLRLTGKPYSAKYSTDLKKSVHTLSAGKMGNVYGYSNDAIISQLSVSDRRANTKTDIEKILDSEYKDLI